jgi:cation diffusion facilitator CzcD-associated flavoprotein CzcO
LFTTSRRQLVSENIQVLIIGAGPYGLSLAAHLSALEVNFRIHGEAMQTWRDAMPRGMLLKSEGFASDLYDPRSQFTLASFCAERNLSFAHTGSPVPVETFIAYGEAFQRRFAPNLDPRRIASLVSEGDGFRLRLDDGDEVRARQVVIASGIRDFGFVPPALAGLPPERVSHSASYGDLGRLDGRRVVIVGAGASAIDLAALLRDRCAAVTVVARAPAIRFHNPPRPRTLADRVLRPTTGLGPGWKSYLSVHAPLAFRAMPEAFRLEVVRRHLGPAPGWFVRDQVEGRVPCLTGASIAEASVEGDGIRLTIERGGAAPEVLAADHVVAATGYRVDLGRLDFLDLNLRDRIRLTGTSPALSADFESSVRGLYFAGASAADSFGPLLRFAFGARFAARRVSRSLSRRRP